MLIHIQMPGAKFVAPPHRWLHEYGQRIKPGAHPLVILQPMGPVMFVFDVSDTEPLPNAPPRIPSCGPTHSRSANEGGTRDFVTKWSTYFPRSETSCTSSLRLLPNRLVRSTDPPVWPVLSRSYSVHLFSLHPCSCRFLGSPSVDVLPGAPLIRGVGMSGFRECVSGAASGRSLR